MAIDLKTEQILSLDEAAKRVPSYRAGKPTSVACIRRWIFDGVKLDNGQVLRLEAIRMGGRWITSFEALERFAAGQTPDLAAGDKPVSTRIPPHERKKASAAATRKLQKAGI